MTQSSQWLNWARETLALAQSGLTYSKNEFDLARYKRLQAITAEMITSQSTLEKDSVRESFSMQAGYATPKVDVRGAVVRDGQILLVQERPDQCWAMPGGWADLGGSPSEMVVREVWEESGFNVGVTKVAAVIDANRLQPFEFYPAYKLIFLCEITGAEARRSNETLAVDFFDPAKLPELSRYRTNEGMTQEVFAHVADSARATHFD